MAKKKHSDLSLSPLNSIREELAKMEEDGEEAPDINITDLRIGISELSVQISKLAGMNISLQSKIVELMIKINDMVEEVTKMVELLKMASEDEGEENKSEEMLNKLDKVVKELEKLNKMAGSEEKTEPTDYKEIIPQEPEPAFQTEQKRREYPAPPMPQGGEQ